MLEGFAPGATKLTYNILKHYLSVKESWYEHPKDTDDFDMSTLSYGDWARNEKAFQQEIQFVHNHPEYKESKEVLQERFETYSAEQKNSIQTLYEQYYFPIVKHEFTLAYKADKNVKTIKIGEDKITLRENRNFFVDLDHCFRVYTPNGMRIIVRSKETKQDHRNVFLLTAYMSQETPADVFCKSNNKKQQKNKARDDLDKFLRHLKNVRSAF